MARTTATLIGRTRSRGVAEKSAASKVTRPVEAGLSVAAERLGAAERQLTGTECDPQASPHERRSEKRVDLGVLP